MEEDRIEHLARLYPSAVVEYTDGSQTTISIEWYEQNREHVTLRGYALILLYKDGSKEERHFHDYESMIEALQEIYAILQKQG